MSAPHPAPWIMDIPPYTPGRSKEEIARAYGVEAPIKLASNENPLGPPAGALAAAREALLSAHLYPDAAHTELKEAAASFFDTTAERIICGNGSDEILDLICRAFLRPGDEVLIPGCTFSYYRIAATACAATVRTTPMSGQHIDVDGIIAAINAKTRLIFFANPNNPTGTYTPREDLQRLAAALPAETLLVADEAYGSFCRAEDFVSALELSPGQDNIITVHTLSKSHGLAGMRVGFGISNTPVISAMERIRPPFNVNLPALCAGTAALADRSYFKQTLDLTWQGIDYLSERCTRLGLEIIPSQTNFVLIRIGERAPEVYEKLLQKGVITRFAAGPGLEEYLRVSIGLPEENRAFITALEKILCSN